MSAHRATRRNPGYGRLRPGPKPFPHLPVWSCAGAIVGASIVAAWGVTVAPPDPGWQRSVPAAVVSDSPPDVLPAFRCGDPYVQTVAKGGR